MVECLGEKRMGITNDNECLTFELVGITYGIGMPEVVLAMAITEGKPQGIDGRIALAIKGDFPWKSPIGASENRIYPFLTQAFLKKLHLTRQELPTTQPARRI